MRELAGWADPGRRYGTVTGSRAAERAAAHPREPDVLLRAAHLLTRRALLVRRAPLGPYGPGHRAPLRSSHRPE